MGNISLILGAMRNFHPQAQGPMINMLKYQRSVLAEPYGFANLPGIFSERHMTGTIETSMVGPKTSIREVVVDLLKKVRPNVDKAEYDIARTLAENVRAGKYQEARINILNNNFSSKKQNLIELCKNEPYAATLVHDINAAKNSQELEAIIQKSYQEYSDNYFLEISKKYTTEPEPDILTNLVKDCEMSSNDFRINILKIINNKSKDKAVLEIENVLKRDYGINYVHLDNINDAKKVLETVKIAANKGIPIPKNVIVTPFETELGRNLTHYDGGHSVILRSCDNEFLQDAFNSIKDKNLREKYLINKLIANLKHSSTNSPYHRFMHEFIHSEKDFGNFDISTTIDSTYDNTIKKLSKYAFDKKHLPEEVRTELRTKQVLDRLNSEEENLLNILS